MVALVISTDALAVPGPPQGHWTYADWESLTDHTNRYEIIGLGEDDTLSFNCLPTITLRIGDLFAGAPDTTL